MAAAVVAALLGLASGPAMALSLGRMTVLSGLGEPLRADIELPDITADEASSLKPEVAPPEAFRAAGLEYNPALADLRIVLQRRADGKSILRLSSTRTVTDPFIDLILQVNWASGRIVRDYTILLDPPATRPAPAAVATAPQITAPAAPAPAAAPPAPAVVPAATPAVVSPARAVPPKPSTPSTTSAAAKPASSDAKQVTVKAGDTASKIASASKPSSVSLDQMLVAMLRANPNAFINGNVNRVKAGAVLNLPDASQASTTPPVEATQIITAQSRDFNAFRSKLASGAPAVQVAEADRKASGKVQAQVDEKKPSTTAPDKLTLSKGALKSKTDEDKIARDKADQEANARVAELAKNITELNKLGAATTVPPAPVASAAKAPVVELPAIPVAVPPPVASAPAEPAPAVSAPVAVASMAVAASAPTSEPAAPVAAPASVPASAASATAPTPAAEESGSWMDTLRDNPLVLAAAGLIALLGGYGVYSARKRKQMANADSSFLESRLQADSFFGASGGQRVDTHADEAPASSMSYSPSQLDAASDVDPVAEADVYLAYGRDLQAEEILKEAMRTTPDRLAVRTKLLEVYAKRRDTKGFELLATQLYALTKGTGADWARAQELGRQFDAENLLYQPGGHPEEIILDGERVVVEPLGATTQPHSILSAVTQPAEDSRLPQMGGAMLDLDLDLGEMGDSPSAQAMEATRPLAPSLQRPSVADLGIDFEDRNPPARRPVAPETSTVPGKPDLDILSLDFDDAPVKGRADAPTVVGGDTTLDFSQFPVSERGNLAETAPTTPGLLDDMLLDHADPLARKLELAEEFRQIGDIDGARDLLEEVVSKAAGTLRAKAQSMLDALT